LSSRTPTHPPALGGIRHSARLPRSRRGLHGQPDDHGIARSAERLRQNRLRRPLSAQRRRYASLSLPSPGYQPPDTGSEGPCRGARRAEGGAALRYPANRACRHLSPLNRTFSPASARAPNISRRRCRRGRPAPVGWQQPGVVRIGLIDLFVLEKNRPDSRSSCNQNAMRPDSHRVRRHVAWTRFSGFTDAHSIRMWQFLGCLLRMPFRAARTHVLPAIARKQPRLAGSHPSLLARDAPPVAQQFEKVWRENDIPVLLAPAFAGVACAIVVLKGAVISYAAKGPNERASGAVSCARHCRPSEALRT
jgi:hypothetical protein